MTDTTPESINALHAHYEKSFEWIHLAEQKRNRLFLFLLADFALLAFMYWSPTEVGSIIVNLADKNGITYIPEIQFLTSVTWVALFYIALQYFTMCINVDRKYGYLHSVEDKLKEITEIDSFYREGKAYNDNYPVVSYLAWAFYQIAAPGGVLIGATWLAYNTLPQLYNITAIINITAYVGLVCLILPRLCSAIFKRYGWLKK